MLNMAKAFAVKASSISHRYGGPYYDAIVHSYGEPVYDIGGSIVAPGVATRRQCQAQVDAATEDMRRDENYIDGDVRILILSDTLSGGIITDDRIQILSGPRSGEWLIQSIARDPFGIYYELRGRRA